MQRIIRCGRILEVSIAAKDFAENSHIKAVTCNFFSRIFINCKKASQKNVLSSKSLGTDSGSQVVKLNDSKIKSMHIDITPHCERHAGRKDALIEILHDLQTQFGFLSDDALIEVARQLNISKAEIYGVVSFYHDFKRSPPSGTVLKICGAEACQAVGCRNLIEYAETQSQSGGYPEAEIEIVYCLGNCALGPSVMIGDSLHGLVDAAKLDCLYLKETIKKSLDDRNERSA